MTESIVAETATRIFADLADPQTVGRATNDPWKTQLWRALAEAGLTLAWVPEGCGGSGASLADGFEVLGIAGRFAVAVPLAETLLAGWLLARAAISSPPGAMTVAPALPADRIALNTDGTLSGVAGRVPFARDARHFAVLASGEAGPVIALVASGAVTLNQGSNLTPDPVNGITFDRADVLEIAPAPLGFDQNALMLMGSTVRSVETAGALESVLARCLQYANERIAFERPIAKFQAVQHQLAQLAGEVAAALAAAGSAADAISRVQDFDDAVFLEATAAKIRCAEAAEKGSAIAHQIHGAIGFTKEHVLHRFTLRMLAWRDDFGNESHWAAALGRRVAAGGADEFWPFLSDR